MLEKREFEKSEFMWRVSTAVTVVSGIFSIVVFVLLVVNYLQIRAADPIDNEMITQMRIEYAQLPDQNDAFAKRIQDLDLLTRKAFFASQNHLRVGAGLLLVGMCIFLIAFKNMVRWKPDLPELAEVPTADREFLAYAQSRQLITWGGVALLGGGLLASLLTESLIVDQAAAGADAPGTQVVLDDGVDAVEAAIAVAKEYPTWDAMQLNWPSFRGPGSTGQAHFTNAPVDWDVEAGTGIRWTADVPLPGANSPVVWGNNVFLSGANEEVREVYCFDTETGDLKWKRSLEAFEGTPARSPGVNQETGYAAPTMAVHGDQVFAIFANKDIVSYDFDGNLLWGFNLGIPDNHYGHSSSLLAYGGLVYVQLDQTKEGRLLALDVATGETAWVKEREQISWASPILAQTPFGPEIILVSTEDVDAYHPESGELLWSQQCLGGEVSPSAAYSDGIVFVANEYATASAIKLTGTKGAIQTEILWEYEDLLPEVSSPVGDGERFYFATSIGDLVCLDAASGEELWAEELSYGFYSSPVLVGDRLYILDMEGKMYIVRAASEFELIGTSDTGEPTFATPAFMDGRIYLRTAEKLYCIE